MIPLAIGDVHRLPQLLPIRRHLKHAAHFSVVRRLLVGHQLASVPVCCNFLVRRIFRLFQLPPVGEKCALVLAVVDHLDFRILVILLAEPQFVRGVHQVAQAVVVAGSPAALRVSATAVRASAHRTTRPSSAHPWPAITAIAAATVRVVGLSRILQLLPRVVAVILVELPVPKYVGARPRFRLFGNRRRSGRIRRTHFRGRRCEWPRRRLRLRGPGADQARSAYDYGYAKLPHIRNLPLAGGSALCSLGTYLGFGFSCKGCFERLGESSVPTPASAGKRRMASSERG